MLDEKKDPEKVFNKLEKLGEGSFGAVFKARMLSDGSIVAAKEIPIEDDLESIVKEIQFMRDLGGSEHIVKCMEAFATEASLWICMEFCGVGSLSDIMRVNNKVLTEPQVACIMKQSLKGLIYLHEQNKIHRDIKAGNILLTEKGVAKLADFGVSGQLASSAAKRHTVVGSPYWLSPEVIQEVGYGVKADIWSLGITAIEAAEGRPPLANIHPMRAIFKIPSSPPPTFAKPDDFSEDFRDFIKTCLVKNPDDRPSAEDLMSHPFIVNSPGEAIFADMIESALTHYAEHGRCESDEEEDDDDSDNSQGSQEGESSEEDEGSHDFGTVLISKPSDDFSTIKATSSSSNTGGGSQPAFMAYLQQKDSPVGGQ
eukprot:TRINITY_DN602_c0_g1_i1.p1 TRINITY_DN602_c0_g1~~TRINITY_DN602_c0_g1_i1.p1  ORF type:complete len:369 (-),score=114.09 TRINITY_DN602_c0_g1_i1:80-1186(-)